MERYEFQNCLRVLLFVTLIAVAVMSVIFGSIAVAHWVTPDDPMVCVKAHETYYPETDDHYDKTVTLCDEKVPRHG